MKNLFLIIVSFILISCSNDEIEIITMRVNHYKQAASGIDRVLVFLVQQGNKIGTDEWSYLYTPINGLDYEYGKIYDIKVLSTSIDNPPVDGTSNKLELIEIIDVNEVTNETIFSITLKSVILNFPPYYAVGDAQSGFTLLNEIDINCNDLCDDLSNALANEDEVKGLFTHGENLLKLEQIIIE